MIKIGKRIIAKDHDSALSVFEKALGLMFRTKVNKPLVFFFEKEQIIPLHMIFVFMSIDVVYINKKNRIVELIKEFKPFTTYTPKHKASKFIELSHNSIGKYRIKVGEIVSIL